MKTEEKLLVEFYVCFMFYFFLLSFCIKASK